MIKNLLFTIVLGVLAHTAFAQCVQTVNFGTWKRTGDSSYVGNNGWIVSGGGTVLQSNQNNNYPRMYVGPDTLINVRVTGTFEVQDYSDDDYIGFVFGFKQTWNQAWFGTNTMNHEYYLFDWKKNNQTWSGYTALEGFSLDKVNGTWARTIAAVFPSYWVHTNSTAFNVLQTDFSTTNGWVPYTSYDFELLYTPTRAVIKIDSDTIFDQTGCFEPGLFGFYNYSQAGARYTDFNYELFVDYTMESENVCLGDTSKFIFIDTNGCSGLNAFSNLDTFYWELGDGTITTDTNPTHIYAYSDTFYVSLIATDVNGCTDTMAKPIYIHESPDAQIYVPNHCYDDSVQFFDTTMANIGHNVAWLWDFGDGNGDTLESPEHIYANPGVYTVQLIIETNAACRDTSDTEMTVYANPYPAFQIDNACDGDQVQFTNTSGNGSGTVISYAWDVQGNGTTNYTNQSPSHIYGTFGQYSAELKLEDTYGCTDSLTKTVTVHPNPDAELFVPSVCFNTESQFIDSSQVALGNIHHWLWDFGDGNIHEDSISGSIPSPGPLYQFSTPGAQSVSLTVETDSGCFDTKLRTINVYHLPVASFTADTACDNEATQFISTSTAQSGVVTKSVYLFGDGDSASAANAQHDYPSSGMFNVTLMVRTNQGCRDTVSDSIRVYPAPNTAFAWANNVCEGDPLPFYDQSTIAQVTPGGDQIVAWLWEFDKTLTDSNQNTVYNGTSAQDIFVELTTWSNYGCSFKVDNTASIYPLPNATMYVDEACVDFPTEFANTSKVQVGLIADSYWDFGDGSTSIELDPDHTYTLPGNYDVVLRTVSNKGCEDTVIKEIFIPETPRASFTPVPEEGCSPLTITLQNNSALSVGTMEYEWFVDDSLVSEEFEPNIILENDTLEPVQYSIKLIATSDEGCVGTVKVEEAITVLPAPKAGFNFSRRSVDMFDPFMSFKNTSQHGVRWEWFFGDGEMSTEFQPDYAYELSGEYMVSQVTWNAFNCPDTVSKYLEVEPVTTLYVPNSFTPNGDGINDTWFVKGFNEGKQFEISIWNRWGELLFEGETMDFSWDGKLPNSNDWAPNGSYAYMILYETSTNEVKELRGTFVLHR